MIARPSAMVRIIPFAVLLLMAACAANDSPPAAPAGPPTITVAESSARPGETVNITAKGFPAATDVVVGAGPPDSEYQVLTRTRTTSAGEVDVSVTVPQSERALVFVVATPDNQTKVVSDKVMIPGGKVTLTGTITDEGVECPAMRGEDGKLYTIATTERDRLTPGTKVRITGTPAEMSICQQGTTINAESIVVVE